MILVLLSFSLAKAQTVALAADSLSGLPGSQIGVPVRVSDFAGILSLQGTIEWNPAVASFVGVSAFGLTGMNAGSFGTTLTTTGKLTYSWDDAMLQGVTLPDSSILFAVDFDLVGQMGSGTSVAFSNNPTNLEFVDSNFTTLPHQTQAGYLLIEDTTTTNLSDFYHEPYSLQVFPNPLNHQSVVEFDGGMEENVRIELWDVMGNRINGLEVPAVSGRNRVALNEGFAEGISRGIYWIFCIGREGFSRQKLIVE